MKSFINLFLFFLIKRFAFIFLILAAYTPLHAQTNTFEIIYNLGHVTLPYSLEITTDEDYLISGTNVNYSNLDGEIFIKKINKVGKESFHKIIKGTRNYNPNRVCAIETSDGGYAVVGTCDTPFYINIYIIKLDSLGNLIWEKKLGGTTDHAGHFIQQTYDGGYIIGGSKKNSASGWDMFLLKTDSQGNELWSRIFGGTRSDYGWVVRQSKDSGFVFIGTTTFGINSKRVYLVKTDVNGNILWQRKLNETQNAFANYFLSKTIDNGFIITAQNYLIKIDSVGYPIWTRTLSSPLNSATESFQKNIVIAGDNGLFVTDRNGILNWEWHPPTTQKKNVMALQTPDSGFIILGKIGISGSEKTWIAKLDKLGSNRHVQLLFPIGGETFTIGDSVWIKWKSDYVENVFIRLKYNFSYQSIHESYSADSEKYLWVVPNSPSNDCYIEVFDASDYSYGASNAAPFIIKEKTDVNDKSSSFYFNLYQNFPNPFNSITKIKYTIPTEMPSISTNNQVISQHVKLELYDVLGRKIKTLVDELKSAGEHEINLDADKLTSGIFWYTLNYRGNAIVKKLAIVK